MVSPPRVGLAPRREPHPTGLAGVLPEVANSWARFSFGPQMGNIELDPVARVSCEIFRNPKSAAQQRVHAYNYLEQCLTLILHEVRI